MKMDFPNKNMGIFQPAMLVYQRVVPRRVLMLRVFFPGLRLWCFGLSHLGKTEKTTVKLQGVS